MIQAKMTAHVQHVEPSYYLKEYDDVLMGKRKTYSSALMAKEQGPYMCAELLRDIFKYYMHWTPVDIRDKLTPDVATKMKIWPLIKRIPCPAEVDASREMYYVAWHLYPETRNIREPELIIKLYTDILAGRVKKFPSVYFDGNAGYLRAHILLMTMIREYLPPFANLEAVYAFFASVEGRQCISKYKLTIPLRELYGSALAYLHDSLPDSQKSEELYTKYQQRTQLSRELNNYLPVTPEERAALLQQDTRPETDSFVLEEYEDDSQETEIVNLDELPQYTDSSDSDVEIVPLDETDDEVVDTAASIQPEKEEEIVQGVIMEDDIRI